MSFLLNASVSSMVYVKSDIRFIIGILCGLQACFSPHLVPLPRAQVVPEEPIPLAPAGGAGGLAHHVALEAVGGEVVLVAEAEMWGENHYLTHQNNLFFWRETIFQTNFLIHLFHNILRREGSDIKIPPFKRTHLVIFDYLSQTSLLCPRGPLPVLSRQEVALGSRHRLPGEVVVPGGGEGGLLANDQLELAHVHVQLLGNVAG